MMVHDSQVRVREYDEQQQHQTHTQVEFCCIYSERIARTAPPDYYLQIFTWLFALPSRQLVLHVCFWFILI